MDELSEKKGSRDGGGSTPSQGPDDGIAERGADGDLRQDIDGVAE